MLRIFQIKPGNPDQMPSRWGHLIQPRHTGMRRPLVGNPQNLRRLFPQNRDLGYTLIKTRNKTFENAAPIEVIREYGFAGLLMVLAYLDRAHGQ